MTISQSVMRIRILWSPVGLVKMNPDSVGSCWELRLCMSTRLPDDVDGDGVELLFE